ncbi:GH92 family glycosyl hydrolase [Halosquirtibacter xylanolyticus]|uniref:GH92 family glycosyl hydrolase n=1 Tax=Halosquirtibacter xylanolyticus TaxID=3374599 RepID=UPI003748AF59|nr:GH92 family glycosyl hydrolase [Prolixibacteraceae bacterium]
MNNTKLLLLVSCLFGLFSCVTKEKNSADNNGDKLIDYVNVFVGTDGPGNTYPGATTPFGMVQLSPDNGIPGWDRIAGYFYPDSTIAGFSHTHLTGTGAGDLYDILVMPYNSRFTSSLTDGAYRPYSKFDHKDEVAAPGYYSVLMKSSGIRAELTTSDRVGVHRYTFPKDDDSRIAIDLGFAMNWDAATGTHLHVIDNKTIEGYRFSKGWARDQKIYFIAEFSKPADRVELTEEDKTVNGSQTEGTASKVLLHYATSNNEVIELKVGLSSVSIEGARKNMNAEVAGKNFDAVKVAAQEKWEASLSKVKAEGTLNQKRIFYSNYYHLLLAPTMYSDVDGRYKGVGGEIVQSSGKIHYDTFSLWDTFRTAHPLFTLIEPERVDDFVLSLMDHYKQSGRLPVWSLAGEETNMMIGYHAVPVIVDAYFKGFKGFDPEEAFEACKASAMVDERDIDKYKSLGYIPYNEGHENWSVSKTMEYAYDDWCIAQFAKALNKTDDYKYFTKRANYWRNVYDKRSTFMRARNADGDFVKPFIPKEYTNDFCESNAWQYVWFVPQDVDGLVNAMGGKEPFIAKLDSMFSYYPETEDKLPIFSTGMIGQYAHGNEPSHHVAYLYNYVGLPWKTQELTRRIIESQYFDRPNGYCGNEDCGQMSAWLMMSAMGLYPVNPADGQYAITSPWMPLFEVKLPKGKRLRIEAPGVDDKSIYIQEVTWNDVPLEKPFIYHKEIMKGGVLHFEMGDAPNKHWN